MRPRYYIPLAAVILSTLCLYFLIREKPDLPSSITYGESPPNIVLVVADSLRSDHLGSYGYHRDTSPFVDGLGETGIRFEQVKAQTSWTFPSMVSIFTGLTTISFYKKGDAAADDLNLLPEILQKHGYHTYGISANPHLREHTNFLQGFDHFEYVESFDGQDINLRLFQEVMPKLEEPYFLWLHYMDTHAPYSPPFQVAREINPEIRVDAISPGCREKAPMKRRMLQNAIDLYDAEILYWDRLVEEVFQRLDSDANLLWVITSDHGEEFNDHGGVGHGVSLYEELLDVPLILYSKQMFDHSFVIEEPVSMIDLLPTLLSLARISDEELYYEGQSLLTGRPDKDPFLSYAAIWKWEPRISRTLRAVYMDHWKYTRDYTNNQTTLHDLEKDPEQRFDLLKKFPEIAAGLDAQLKRYMDDHMLKYKGEKAEEADEETKKQLKALGY